VAQGDEPEQVEGGSDGAGTASCGASAKSTARGAPGGAEAGEQEQARGGGARQGNCRWRAAEVEAEAEPASEGAQQVRA